jgi:hypothetical protein
MRSRWRQRWKGRRSRLSPDFRGSLEPRACKPSSLASWTRKGGRSPQGLEGPLEVFSYVWMIQFDPHRGVVLPAENWITATRVRLGCEVLHQAKLCGVCGTNVMYEQGVLVAGKSSPRGGTMRFATSWLWRLARGTRRPVPGLITSAPSLRSADILTWVGPGRGRCYYQTAGNGAGGRRLYRVGKKGKLDK